MGVMTKHNAMKKNEMTAEDDNLYSKMRVQPKVGINSQSYALENVYAMNTDGWCRDIYCDACAC